MAAHPSGGMFQLGRNFHFVSRFQTMLRRLTLPSECVSLNRQGFEDLIHPRHRRGGGNVGIGFIDFQGLWEGGKTAPSFSGLPQTVISTACFDHRELSGGDLHRSIHPVLLELHRADVVQRRVAGGPPNQMGDHR
jgi:hypothetical protein